MSIREKLEVIYKALPKENKDALRHLEDIKQYFCNVGELD
jgi:hypothetical protein